MLLLLVAGCVWSPASATAVPATAAARVHCGTPQVLRTVTYVKRRGGPRRTVTACGPRVPGPGVVGLLKAGTVIPPVLRRARREAVANAPKAITRLRSGAAARRALAADPVTDKAIDGWFLGASAGVRAHAAARIASSVQTGGDDGPSEGVPQGPAGTKTTMHRSGTEWSDATPDASTGVVSTGSGPEQNPGFDKTITTETTSTRIGGVSSQVTKRLRIKVRMARCPDATGLGEGPVLYEETTTHVMGKADGGRAVITETSTYEGTLRAQFGDDAALVSSLLTGEWSHRSETRVSSGRRGAEQRVALRSVSGTSRDDRLGPRGESLTVRVTGASDDEAALGGYPTGTWVAGIMPPTFAQDGLDRIVRNTAGGACVSVVADPTALSLHGGESATIKAHPVDTRGRFPGRVSASATGGTITPEGAQADPDATFTFVAPPGSRAGDHDTITFRHVSRRGRASGTTVDVTYLPPPPSHTYRILGATLDETVTAQRPGSSFPGCPEFTGRQDNSMTLGIQPAPTGGFATQGHLLDAPQGFIGILSASGVAAASTTMHGCDLASAPFQGCTNTATGTITRDVSFQVTLPAGGPAQLRWTFGFGPTAGLGSEGAGTTCLSPPLSWTTTDFALGDQIVPRSVFEAATPQQLSFSHDFDVTDPNPSGAAQIHAGDRYTMTIQRVRDDGSPL